LYLSRYDNMIAGPQNTLALSSADVNDAKEVVVNEGRTSMNGPVPISSKITIGMTRAYSASKVFEFKFDTTDEKDFTTSESRSVEGNIPRE
jgi:hypothetical protein